MSSESESDEDYVPGKPEQLSEEESADDETEAQYEKEVELKANKRKSLHAKQDGKKSKFSNLQTRNKHSDEEEKQEPKEINPEVEKKKEDDLWAMFLGGTDTPKPSILTTHEQIKTVASKPSSNNKIATNAPPINSKAEIESKEAKIFEFAGEKVVVENNVIKEVFKATPSSATCPNAGSTSASTAGRARGSGGLSGLLGQLNKKNKLSTLEKTKLDWQTFKKKEGIEEELQSFNKGKDGYLERQDFLERADLRQFEIERDLRTTRRSNR